MIGSTPLVRKVPVVTEEDLDVRWWGCCGRLWKRIAAALVTDRFAERPPVNGV